MLHLELLHLVLLLPLHLLPLPDHRSYGCPLLVLNILLHLLLIELAIENTLVGILHFVLIHTLLLNLLGGLRAPDLFPCPVSLLESFFVFLLFQGEVSHVFGVDVRLFVQSCALGGQVTLLVRVEGIIFELGHGGHVGTRLARLETHH